MAKMLRRSVVVRLMFTLLLLVSMTTAQGPRVYSTNRPNSDVALRPRSESAQDNYSSSHNKKVVQKYFFDKVYPVVTVELLPGNRINATQKRFLTDPLVVQDEEYKWFVPLNYQTKGGKYGLVWMNKTDVVFDVPLNSSDDWILFNNDASGMYRVNYNAILWDRITKQLNDNHKVFSELSRSVLINDAGELAKAGYLGYDTFLDLIRYASEEREQAPWSDIYDNINFIKSLISDTADFSRFQRYVLNLTSSLMDELQVKDEGGFDKNMMRQMIMSLSCSAGHMGCIENSTRLFKAWIQNDTTNHIPEIFIQEVCCTGLADSLLESEWNAVFERLSVATSPREKWRLATALACSRNLTIRQSKLWKCALDDTNVNPENCISVIFFIGFNPASKYRVMNWLKLNTEEIDKRVMAGYSGAGLTRVTSNMKTKELRQQVADFLNNYRFAHKEQISQILDNVDRNIGWMDRNFATIVNWLEQNIPT